jgi:hypothetical protein
MKLNKLNEKIKNIEESKELADICLRSDNNEMFYYAGLILESMITNIKSIITFIDEDNTDKIYSYFMKPLIENYVDLENTIKFKFDYILALKIDGAVRIDKNKDKENLYLKYGEKSIKVKSDKELKKTIIKCYNKLENKKVRKLFRDKNGKELSKKLSEDDCLINEMKFEILIVSKINLLDGRKDYYLNRDYIYALYSLVNNYSHFNLLHIKNVDVDCSLSMNEIQKFLINIANRMTKLITRLSNDYEKIALIPEFRDESVKKRAKSIHINKVNKYLRNELGQIILQPKIDLKNRGQI